MSQIWENETLTREKLYELRKNNRCKVCHGMLNVFLDLEIQKAYLACNSDRSHEGIEREAEPLFEPNIPTRREDMEQQHGSDKALALRRFDAVATLSKETATEILTIMWPEAKGASPAEFAKALGLCIDYGLDPRLNELFMLPFKVKVKDDKGNVIGEKTKYETVRGIRATRKVALRKHKYSYLDNTPRYMTEDEEKRAFKTVDPDRVRYITKLKDVETGAEFPGYGQWPKYRTWTNPKTGEIKRYLNEPKGIDKGNSMENMSAIRSERAALERGYPADMPSSRIPVVDEAFIEGEFTEGPAEDQPLEEREEGEQGTSSSQTEGDEKLGEQPTKATGEGETKQTSSSSPKEKDKKPKTAPAPELGPFGIDLTWLNESLRDIHWAEETTKSWLAGQFKVDATGKLTEVLNRLTREQAEQFTNEIQQRAAQAQAKLFE